MSVPEFAVGEWMLAEIERDCQEAAEMLISGYESILAAADRRVEAEAFIEDLRSKWGNYGAKWDRARRVVYSFWMDLSRGLEREGGEKTLEFLLNDMSIFGRTRAETTEALLFHHVAYGWHELAGPLGAVHNDHSFKGEWLRGRILSGEVLARWSKVDEGWAISGNAVRAWLMEKDRSTESVISLIARVDETLEILARVH